MKKNIQRLLHVTWLILLTVTIYNSVEALKGNAAYCSGMYCELQSDCWLPCVCNNLDNTCYSVIEDSI
jgi:hypothetical protein